MANLTQEEQRKELSKLHVQEDHLIGIGCVAIRAAALDATIELKAGEFSHAYPKTVMQQIGKLSTPQKINFIKECLERELPEHRQALSEFISEIHATRSERDDVIHRIWMPGETDDEKILMDTRSGRQNTRPRRATAAWLRKLENRLVALFWELQDWSNMSNQVRSRRYVASLGKRQPPGGPPIPPRKSAKDQQRT